MDHRSAAQFQNLPEGGFARQMGWIEDHPQLVGFSDHILTKFGKMALFVDCMAGAAPRQK
jgi:hypothetical protein